MVIVYNVARVAAESKNFDWVNDAMKASILSDGYVPNFLTDNNVSLVGTRFVDVQLTHKQVDSAGWMSCDQIVFGSTLITAPFSQVLVWRVNDGLPVFLCKFLTVTPTGVARPFALLAAVSKPGFLRL